LQHRFTAINFEKIKLCPESEFSSKPDYTIPGSTAL